MSEIINNREYRKKALKELILELHDGKSVDEVKEKFAEIIEGVSAMEISEMEAAIIAEGMPIEEVQRLCDVHSAVFRGSIEDIHKEDVRELEKIPGHPLNTFVLENRELKELLEGEFKNTIDSFEDNDDKEQIFKMIEILNLLWDIDKHYSRKENIIFPYLEKYGITAPPKVMWGVDDEIRAEIKGIKLELENYRGNKDEIIKRSKSLTERINEMIFKEENILFPMCKETLSEDEWISVAEDSDEIGYCLVAPTEVWKPYRAKSEDKGSTPVADKPGYIKFDTGYFTQKELQLMLNTLPFDITFIDKDDTVKYFSQGAERIFARTKAIIGRTVQNCHPPTSVHTVESILHDFKKGAKDSEGFWIKAADIYVYIKYFALRDEEGKYMGTVEVTQNIKPIQEIQGEKRLLD